MVRRKLAVIVVNVNGVTGYEIDKEGTYGHCVLPINEVKSATEAAQCLHDLGYGNNFRLDVCLAGTRVSSIVYVGSPGGPGRWQESQFSALQDFPRYPHPEVFHTGLQSVCA